MSEIDDFARGLLEESKRFLEKGKESDDPHGKRANLHAALMLAFCSLEAHVNSIAEEVSMRADTSIHDKSVLLEKTVRLEDGVFALKDSLQMTRLEDRIQFIHRRFGGHPIDRTQVWWTHFLAAANLRNDLTHPKGVPAITEDGVSRAIQAIIDTLDAIYEAVYRTGFPAASRGLLSRLNF